MTILITADLHLSAKSRDEYRLDFLKRLNNIAYKHDAGLILILGDICEEKDNHSAWLVNEVVGILAKLAYDANIIILRGNHDYIDITSPFFSFLSHINNIKWVNVPTVLKLSNDMGPCLFLPHTRDYKRDWSGLDREMNEADYILAHNTFDGASEGGRKLHGIPLDVLPKKTKIISGDVHTPQSFGNVTYVGAPYLVDFGDDYKPRMLLIDKDEVVNIPCSGPQKMLLEINDVADLEDAERSLMTNDVIKIRVHLPAAQYDQWTAIQKGIREWASHKRYQIDSIVPQVDRKIIKSAPRKIDRLSDEQLMRTYTKTKQVDDETLNTGLSFLDD